MPEIQMPERPDLQVLLEKWQPILRLRDWEVTIDYSRQRDLPDNKQGTCWFILNKKVARIKILEPNDYPTRDICSEQDVEQCVVHELLHLHRAGFDEDFRDWQCTAEEQMINALASVFVGRRIS